MKKAVLLLSILVIQLNVLAQTKAETALQTVSEKFPQEKVHLFLNKEAFVAGETILLKAYLFSGNVQSNISKTLYVELLNEQKQSISQSLLPLINATGEATINLPRYLPEGNYYLRAYTRWMLNFDDAFQYLFHLPVYNPASTKRLSQKPEDWTAAVYPESGNLLADKENKMVVRLTAKGTLPQKWEGYITEENASDKKLLNFSSLNPQLAVFNFKPEADKTYILHIGDSSGNKSVLKIKPSLTGAAIKAKQQGKQLNIEMLFQGLANGGSNYKLIAASDGQVFYSARLKKSDPVVTTSINIGSLMTGVVQLTLFNSNEKQVAERLVFIQTEAEPEVNVKTAATSPKAEGLTEWIIEADTSLRSAYAISVTDASITQSRKRSIKSDLWLGDFTSDIYNPQWYFDADTIRFEALEALLISEKWSRYRWKEILSDSFPTINHQPEGYLSYKGMATDYGKLMKEKKLNLLFKYKDGTLQFAQVKTDQQGTFYIRDAAFYDSVQVFYQPSSKKEVIREVAISFERENRLRPYNGALPYSPLHITDSISGDAPAFVKRTFDMLNEQENGTDSSKTLKEVKVSAKLKSPKELLNEKLSSALFNTVNEVIIDFVNEEQNVLAYNNIFDWLEGRVPGLNFVILDNQRFDPVTGVATPAGVRIPIMRGGEPTIFLDEVAMDVTLVHNLSVSEIAMIKVIKGYFLGATSGGGGSGAIAIYTKKAGLLPNEKKIKSPSGSLAGYSSFETFKEMNPADTQSNKIKNDIRQQLYWSTQFFKSTDTKAKVPFYNNKFASAARVVITGFTKNAQPVYFEKVINGKK